MKITIHGTTGSEHIIERDKVDKFIEEHVLPGQHFSVGDMQPTGWYEREYLKASDSHKGNQIWNTIGATLTQAV